MDTITLRGPATPELLRQLPERRYRDVVDVETGEIDAELVGGSLWLDIGNTHGRLYGDLRTGRPEIGLRFSAPAVLDGHNRNPLPLASLVELTTVVWDLASEQLQGLPLYADLRLARLDLARDFLDVECIPHNLWFVSQLPVARMRISTLQRGANGQWQSLTRGNPGRWRAVSYDKSVQLREKADREPDEHLEQLLLQAAADSVGRQRWELQMMSATLSVEGIRSLSLDERTMFSMAQRYFDRTRFDAIIGGGQRLRTELDGLTPAEKRGLLTVLAADLLDTKPPYGHNKLQEYRRLAARLRVTAADLVDKTSGPRRLDFASGIELRDDEALIGLGAELQPGA